MAKHKKKRPAEGRLKVIAGGGGVRAVLPGKGPQWKKDRDQAPSTGAHAASSTRAGPPNRRRDEVDDDVDAATEASPATPARRTIPRTWIYGGIGVAVLVVAYIFLRNPPPGETPTSPSVAPTGQSSSANGQNPSVSSQTASASSEMAAPSGQIPSGTAKNPSASSQIPSATATSAPATSPSPSGSAPSTSASVAKPAPNAATAPVPGAKKSDAPSEYQ